MSRPTRPPHASQGMRSNDSALELRATPQLGPPKVAEQYVGLETIDDGIWQVYFGHVELCRFHERDGKIEDSLGRKAPQKQ